MAKHRPRERRPLVSTDVWDNDESMTALWHLVHLCKSTNQWLLVRVRCELSAARLATLEHLLQPFVRRRTLGGGANHAPAATCHVWVCLDARQRCQLSYDILANAPKACVVLSPGKVAHVKFNPPPPPPCGTCVTLTQPHGAQTRWCNCVTCWGRFQDMVAQALDQQLRFACAEL